MKIITGYLLLLAALVFSSESVYAQGIPADSLYLGQTPPGNIPSIFNLPVTNGLRACERIAVSSDGKEIYYGEINTYPATVLRVKGLKYQDNKWEGPFNVFEGFIAPKLADNDSTLYLQTNSFYTYYSKRTDTGWSVPVRLLPQTLHTHYFQKTNINNYYSSSYYEGSSIQGDICRLTVVNGDTALQSMGIPLNSSFHENDFLIADDESYILFSRNVPGAGSDMYLSFKKEDGKWTNPKKLEQVNKPGYNWEYGQFVSKDGKYLFFTSGGVSWSSYYTYWIRIDNIIDSMKHSNYAPYLNCQIPEQSGIPGQLFTYTVPDTTFIDDDGNNTLTYSAALSNGNPLPAWLSFDDTAQTFRGIPTESNTLNITVTSTDSADVSVTCTFILNITLTGIDDNREQIPADLKLFQNYPNPFNPSTVIEFAVPKAGRYTLNLYNAIGELIKNISDREYGIGYHKEILNAGGLSSGVYLYILTGEESRLAGRMLLLR